ncbi:hypothetical protein EGW08_017920 [Elysia chlorotica]|uniref:Palmitoyltransferase n=1 Tax=Elysia chlorotica TaxID=188477 RepID=A0A3S1H8L4_ELYCH|nr:hypothetical protein EGW08_017920 [Elysia chlorotica]
MMDAGLLTGEHFGRAAYQSGIGMDKSSPITPRHSASHNGTVQRSTRGGDFSSLKSGKSKLDLSDRNLSLMDKFKMHYQVLACYVFAMGEANWLSAICYSNRLPDARDRPSTLGQNFQKREELQRRLVKTDKNGLEWKFCDKCQRYKPPRTHHCDVCRACILRRDHHCFLIGTCIGHFNQRYFIPFCFLGIITSVVGFCLTVVYLRSLPDGAFWGDYIFPWALVKLLLGHVSWRFCLLTFHAMMLLVFGMMCVLYGLGQLSIVAMGITLYEVAKKVDVKVTSSPAENMRIVFGDYWLVNFLFPGQILFKQRHDGMHWDNIKFGTSVPLDKVSVE